MPAPGPKDGHASRASRDLKLTRGASAKSNGFKYGGGGRDLDHGGGQGAGGVRTRFPTLFVTNGVGKRYRGSSSSGNGSERKKKKTKKKKKKKEKTVLLRATTTKTSTTKRRRRRNDGDWTRKVKERKERKRRRQKRKRTR